MQDLISRQAAIDAICKDWCNTTYKDCKALKAVPPADRPTDGDLISRADAIEALGEEPLVWCDEEYEIAERSQWRDDVEAIKSVPSADRPRGGDLISRQAATSIPIIPKEHRKVFRGEDDAFETGWNEALACVNMLPSADKPRGEWVSKKELIDAINDMEVVYDGDEDEHKEHDISKLVRVMFKDIIDNLPSADMRGDTE